jgi:uncharacterized protein
MKIIFREIAKETRFEEPVKAMDVDLGHDYSAHVEPTILEVTAAPVSGGCRVSGSFAYRAAVPCSRCLTEVKVSGEAHFRINYYPASAAPSEEEAEIPLEETEDVYVDEDHVTGEELVSQQIYLEIPEKVLCKEDCRGICPECGADLNKGACGCLSQVDQRWSGLVGLSTPRKE